MRRVLKSMRRTASGDSKIEQARTLEALGVVAAEGRIEEALVPPRNHCPSFRRKWWIRSPPANPQRPRLSRVPLPAALRVALREGGYSARRPHRHRRGPPAALVSSRAGAQQRPSLVRTVCRYQHDPHGAIQRSTPFPRPSSGYTPASHNRASQKQRPDVPREQIFGDVTRDRFFALFYDAQVPLAHFSRDFEPDVQQLAQVRIEARASRIVPQGRV